MISQVASELGSAQRLLVLAHRDPDGDALGAALGLMHLLGPLGKEIFVHVAGVLPEEYLFLPGVDKLHRDLPPAGEVDLAVLLDCHEPIRAGEAAAQVLAQVGRALVIDHHLGQSEFGQMVWLDPGYAATCEMLTLMAKEEDFFISREAATCLFVGLQTDTGRFGYSNTTPRTLRMGAKLIELGADPWAITQEAYSTSLARLRLMGRIFAGMTMLAGGQVVLARVSLADMREAGAAPSDLDRVVEELRAIRGVEVAVLLKELADGGVKASMRSRGRVEVGSLAISLGGGGHKNAAGARLEGGLDQAAARLGDLLTQQMGAGA